MTVKVQGKSFEFSEDEAREVMKQLFDRFGVEASNDETEAEREFDPDDREAIASYYEENYTMDHGYAVSLMRNVLDYAFYMIEDRDERIDFLDYVLEDFRKNAGEER